MPARAKKKKVTRRKPKPRDKNWYVAGDPQQMYEAYPVQGLQNAQKEVTMMMQDDYVKEIIIYRLVPVKKFTMSVKEEDV